MAQFIGRVKGGRGEVTRLGHKTTGLEVTARGWDVGARVELIHKGGVDVVRVYRTGGSNNPGPGALLAEYDASGNVTYLMGRDPLPMESPAAEVAQRVDIERTILRPMPRKVRANRGAQVCDECRSYGPRASCNCRKD